MPVTYVQSKLAYTGATTSTLTTDSAVTSGNFLIVYVMSSTLGNPTLSSSPSVTWTQITSVLDTSTANSAIRVFQAVATSTAVMTVTITSPANDSGIHFWEVNTGGIVPILDTTPATTTRANNGALGSYTITTVRDNTFIFSAISDEQAGNAGIGTLTGADFSLASNTHCSASAVILNAGTAGVETITWSWSVSNTVYATATTAFYLPTSTSLSWLAA
jgi:hypothetical protein